MSGAINVHQAKTHFSKLLERVTAGEEVVIPPIHQDPFDRILIAQTISEGMSLMSRDRQIHRYPAPLLSC